MRIHLNHDWLFYLLIGMYAAAGINAVSAAWKLHEDAVALHEHAVKQLEEDCAYFLKTYHHADPNCGPKN